jgi:isopropylmalate/homocitrate/citramalate synthase
MSFENLVIEDTTLRDGEQTPGVAFGYEDKLRVFRALVAAGLRWIEAGIPAMGGDELRALRQMLAESGETTVVVWNRGVVEDVKQSLREGFRAIHIGLPASNVLLRGSVAKDRKWLLQRARELIGRTKDAGAFVSVSAEDAGRTDLGALVEYAEVVSEAGADRLRLSDTVGVMTPEGYDERVRAVREATDIAVQCHCHNDFGLAAANTLAGLKAGATHFHVTVNGIGERAGMPDLSQVVLALRRLYGYDLGVRSEHFKTLSLLVSQLTGVQCPPWQPVVGANVFAHESGIHVNGVLRDPSTFEPFEPELVGAERSLLLGKHSGRTLIRSLLEGDGQKPSDEDLSACLASVRARATADGGRVTLGQLRQIYSEVAG